MTASLHCDACEVDGVLAEAAVTFDLGERTIALCPSCSASYRETLHEPLIEEIRENPDIYRLVLYVLGMQDPDASFIYQARARAFALLAEAIGLTVHGEVPT
jgi:hypothetical protein